MKLGTEHFSRLGIRGEQQCMSAWVLVRRVFLERVEVVENCTRARVQSPNVTSPVTIAERQAMSKLIVGLKVVIWLDRVLTRNLQRDLRRKSQQILLLQRNQKFLPLPTPPTLWNSHP